MGEDIEKFRFDSSGAAPKVNTLAKVQAFKENFQIAIILFPFSNLTVL